MSASAIEHPARSNDVQDDPATVALPVIRHDLTDEQWSALLPIFASYDSDRGRPRELTLRGVLDGIFYKHAHGCSWRDVPEQYGGFRSLNSYFKFWERTGILKRVSVRLAMQELQPCYDEYLRLLRHDQRIATGLAHRAEREARARGE